ncbi:hypothetical protein Cgig2_019057 [Carnegiea gigantea]|uniref:Uncharacterized protein n=1 Tax=Carnegiea gigantea TaxID=171969 RepID=A0A9Q1KEU6_9CARY|nr:hypothetical protein Cgig2_019057 [Carnegiea gigantea]
MESSASTLLLLLRLHHHPPPPPPPPPWRFPISHSSHSRILFLPLRRCLRPIGARKFDFGPRSYNADDDDDDFGGGEFDRTRTRKRRRRRQSKRRQWWFDGRERSQLDEREPSMLDQVVESLWFLKVLRSYGWFLPAILVPLLLATGPKAFLMAFSLPLGLSLLTFAFKKLMAWLEGTPEPKQSRKTKSPFAQAKASSMEEGDDLEDEEEIQPSRRSWTSRYRSAAASNNGPMFKGSSSSKFGGWDELVIEEEEMNGAPRPDQKMDEEKIPMQEEPASMPVRERELPLLLQLLVALFPFLGSWTSLLR